MRVFRRQFHHPCPELRRANLANSKVQPTFARNAAFQRFGGIEFQDVLLRCPDNVGVPLIRYEIASRQFSRSALIRSPTVVEPSDAFNVSRGASAILKGKSVSLSSQQFTNTSNSKSGWFGSLISWNFPPR